MLESKDFNHKNYTLILSAPESPLAQYVDENINDYLEVIINHCDEIITDSEPVVLSILNNNEITFENKLAYIEVLNTRIALLKDIADKAIWALLLQNNLVKYSESNILEYFFNSEKNLDNILIEFPNQSEYLFSHLKFLQFGMNHNITQVTSLFHCIFYCLSDYI